jgi:hypothetical protein
MRRALQLATAKSLLISPYPARGSLHYSPSHVLAEPLVQVVKSHDRCGGTRRHQDRDRSQESRSLHGNLLFAETRYKSAGEMLATRYRRISTMGNCVTFVTLPMAPGSAPAPRRAQESLRVYCGVPVGQKIQPEYAPTQPNQ